ncbi:ribosome-inactivating family protein [Streptomyces sp. SAS_270]|uniref:ribosome-inactivating family protein n=1 Tax=Streptomyces sp. SAS_270 TaxID=3412748 RepID=UPI00403C641E
MSTHILRWLGVSLAVPTALAGAVYLTTPDTASVTHSLPHVQLAAANGLSDNITANFNSGNRFTWYNTYNSVISQIRARVTNGTLRDGILRERPSTAHDYFAVHFQAGVGTPQVSLVFDAANLYVMGYYNHATNTYVRMGNGPDAANPTPQNPVNARTVRNNFLSQGDYGYLERTGHFDRAEQTLGMGSFFSAMSALRDGRTLGSVPATQTAQQAQAITTMIQMFAEGARFDFISSNIGSHTRDERTFTAGTFVQVRGDGGNANELAPTDPVRAVDWENVWSQLSRYVRARLNDRGAFHFAVGGALILTTMQAAANQLAVDYSG